VTFGQSKVFKPTYASKVLLQDEISTAIAAFTELWQGGELETSDSVSQGMLGSFLDIDAHTENLADEMLGKEGDPYAPSALTMACLNALAFFSSAGRALAVPPTEMTLTHPLVAEVLLRVISPPPHPTHTLPFPCISAHPDTSVRLCKLAYLELIACQSLAKMQ